MCKWLLENFPPQEQPNLIIKSHYPMKLTRIICAAALVALATGSAQATTTYNNGDLFLGVYSQSTSSDYLIDLGQSFNFNISFSIPISGLTTDLNSIVGTGWATNDSVFFSVFGGTVLTSRTEEMYATNPSGAGTPWQTATTGESAIGSAINSIELAYSNNTSNVPSGNPQAYEQGDSDANSYYFWMNNGGESLGYFNPTIDANPSSPLDFEYLAAGSVHNATDLGTFTLDGPNNSLDFSTAAVPEPSTLAAFLVGAAALIAVRRRRA
jgi:hypothetical protein